jgi:uncharacterized membrane protein YfcA
VRPWMPYLAVPSIIGAMIGAVLLLWTPSAWFARIVPWLILFATALFAAQVPLTRAMRHGARAPVASWTSGVVLFQLAVAIYGGYFGAGIGILMLALLGFLGLSNIHAANGIKNFFNLCINVIAAGYFIYKGVVVWPAALVIVAGATLGGYAGARFAQRIGKQKARTAVIVIGLGVTAILLWQQATK